ncbi:hypothetical protein D3C76_985970 [compost metagenome]|uniref:RHS repeat-associated core domain-containing protein n=1 Tax=Pseudomonas putida TaxID=303 RepID=UPI000FA517FD|nr:RHS repeat-associated core domain-containing protein [Pseudomonas putida]TCP76941.1 RHS repeat-associated protein [Pseudomonas putida]UVL78703.1 RHS repeat-associated core domain-containing protein [Pseudomonas putida]
MAKVTCGMPDGTVKERAERSCEKFSYAPYGFNVAPLAGVLGFDGQPRDGVTGCYLLGAGYRVYNPALMRFNSADSWSPFGKGGWHTYAYVSCDPVNFFDPTGHMRRVKPLKLDVERANRQGQLNASSSITSPVSPLKVKRLRNRDMKDLSPAAEHNYNIFVDAIEKEGLSFTEAAKKMGDPNLKITNKKLGIWQVRLDGGQRMTFRVGEGEVEISQVGGHT